MSASPEAASDLTVGMIGLGQMGMLVLERLRAASFPVRFFARRPEAKTQAIALGAVDAGSLAGVAHESQVVIVFVYDDAQVREVCLGADGVLAAMGAGCVLVNHTTGSPALAPLLAAHAAPYGVHVLDAAHSGLPAAVSKGALTLLIGGDADVLEKAHPVLSAYADTILPVGGLGDGQRVKFLNNAVFGANLAALAAAERVAADLGLDPVAALQAVAHCSGDSRILRTILPLGSVARYNELKGSYRRKDADMLAHLATELGIDLGPLTPVREP